MDETIHIRGDGDFDGMYFTQSRVVGGLLDLLRRGHVDEAVEVYARCTQDLSDPLAEGARGDAALLKDVANLLFRSNDFLSAAKICEELGENDRAALLFDRGKDAANAARLYELLGDVGAAAQMYERAGAYSSAASHYAAEGEAARAAACFARAGEALNAGRSYVAAERADLAVAHLQEIGADEADFHEANALLVDCFVALGSPERAQSAADIAATASCTTDTVAHWVRAVDVAVVRGAKAAASTRLESIIESGLAPDDVKRLARAIDALSKDADATNGVDDNPATTGDVVPFLEGFSHLRALPLFKALSLRDLRRVHAISQVKKCEPGTFLLLDGQPGPGMWLVLSGTVSVQRGGKEIAQLDSGAHVGEMSLVDGGPASADVVAVDDVRALQIERSGFERLLATNDNLALGVTRVLLREMCKRLRNTSALVAGRD